MSGFSSIQSPVKTPKLAGMRGFWRNPSNRNRKVLGECGEKLVISRHTKSDGLFERNHLAGVTGDAINAILVAAGHNLRLLVAWLTALLHALFRACSPQSSQPSPPPELPMPGDCHRQS